MRLRDKVVRLASPRAWRSAARAVGRAVHPLSVERVLRDVDAGKLAKIVERYRIPGERRRWPKYVDVEKWFRINIRRAHDLGLTRTPAGESLNILDLGSGGGFFLFVAKLCGHRGLGIDLADPPLYGGLFELFELERVIWRIRAFEALPEAAAAKAPFDLVTAFSTVFNQKRLIKPWGPEEWAFLLDDLEERFVVAGGRVFLDLNPSKDRSYFAPGVKEYLVSRGAVIDRSKVLLRV